jgi:hypothetical protein
MTEKVMNVLWWIWDILTDPDDRPWELFWNIVLWIVVMETAYFAILLAFGWRW